MVYVKSENMYVDYILGLRGMKVKRLVEMVKEEGLGDGLEVVCVEYG
jgi:hypothetical protein